MGKKANKLRNLIKVFNKIWEEKEGKDELAELFIEKFGNKILDKGIEIKEKDYIVYTDGSSILGIIPKKEKLKRIIENNFKVYNKNKISKFMDFKGKGEEIKSKYSVEFLKIGLNLIKNYEVVNIKMNKDAPIWMECEDFIFVLAPRIEEG